MEQFSLDKYLENPSRKVVTRRGNPVRIICTDRKHGEDELPIVFLEECHNGEFLLTCRKDGRSDTYATPYDLFFADEEEKLTEFERKLKEVLYEHATTNTSSEEKARQYASELLDLARKELQPEFEKELDKAYKSRGEIVYLDGYDKGHEDALKDLPKWKKMPNGIQGNGDFNPTYLVRTSSGYCFTTPCISSYEDSMYIELAELEKLPKEE